MIISDNAQFLRNLAVLKALQASGQQDQTVVKEKQKLFSVIDENNIKGPRIATSEAVVEDSEFADKRFVLNRHSVNKDYSDVLPIHTTGNEKGRRELWPVWEFEDKQITHHMRKYLMNSGFEEIKINNKVMENGRN